MICSFCLGKAERTWWWEKRCGRVWGRGLSRRRKAPKDDRVSGGSQSISDSTGQDNVTGRQAGSQNTEEWSRKVTRSRGAVVSLWWRPRGQNWALSPGGGGGGVLGPSSLSGLRCTSWGGWGGLCQAPVYSWKPVKGFPSVEGKEWAGRKVHLITVNYEELCYISKHWKIRKLQEAP